MSLRMLILFAGAFFPPINSVWRPNEGSKPCEFSFGELGGDIDTGERASVLFLALSSSSSPPSSELMFSIPSPFCRSPSLSPGGKGGGSSKSAGGRGGAASSGGRGGRGVDFETPDNFFQCIVNFIFAISAEGLGQEIVL